jgi:hypothetical protein
MAAVNPLGSISALVAQATALQTSIDALSTSVTSLQSAVTAAQATIATLTSADNFYTKAQVDNIAATKAASSHNHTTANITNLTATGAALVTATDASAARATLMLGSAATLASGAFESAGSVSAHNAMENAHDGLTKPKQWVLKYTGSTGGQRTVTTMTEPASSSTWLSHFPASVDDPAGPAEAIGTSWTITYSSALGGLSALIVRSDAGGGG